MLSSLPGFPRFLSETPVSCLAGEEACVPLAFQWLATPLAQIFSTDPVAIGGRKWNA